MPRTARLAVVVTALQYPLKEIKYTQAKLSEKEEFPLHFTEIKETVGSGRVFLSGKDISGRIKEESMNSHLHNLCMKLLLLMQNIPRANMLLDFPEYIRNMNT